jgi:hypothetical protein
LHARLNKVRGTSSHLEKDVFLEYYDDDMILLGLCSGAFLALCVDEVISTARQAELDAIEWAADAHIQPGDSKTAERAMMATLRAGLTISSYASLYRACSEGKRLKRFEALLETASALYVPILRIFAPSRDTSGKSFDEAQIAGELRRLGDSAAAHGITICLSMSKSSSIDNYAAALSLVAAADHPFIRLAWEDLSSEPPETATKALEKAGKNAALLIARCVDRNGKAVGIAKTTSEWRRRIALFKRAELDPKMGSFVLIGSAQDPAALTAEARVLREIISADTSS